MYAPTDNTERRHFINTLQQYPTPTQYTVIGGDFNCIEDPTKDKSGGKSGIGLCRNDTTFKLDNQPTHQRLMEKRTSKHTRIYMAQRGLFNKNQDRSDISTSRTDTKLKNKNYSMPIFRS